MCLPSAALFCKVICNLPLWRKWEALWVESKTVCGKYYTERLRRTEMTQKSSSFLNSFQWLSSNSDKVSIFQHPISGIFVHKLVMIEEVVSNVCKLADVRAIYRVWFGLIETASSCSSSEKCVTAVCDSLPLRPLGLLLMHVAYPSLRVLLLVTYPPLWTCSSRSWHKPTLPTMTK